ncbi:MAG TPA: Wadjet anti-phage system protein JetD domain-containing protein [Planctomycetota bacterium]|nr:Wadjet anti-phage system protein JetD domain-containing protein [Planctomycetota bacterium]
MWRSVRDRLALLELYSAGRLKRRRSQGAAFAAIAELPWTRVSSRSDELVLVEARRFELAALLTRVWPEWSTLLADLGARGLPPTPEGWAALEDARRAEGLGALPPRLNRRTAASLAAPHSKARLTGRRRAALGRVAPVHDGALRLRPPDGLVVRTRLGVVDLAAVARVLGEATIAGRAFDEDLRFEGPLRGVLLVENLGAWRDLPEVDGVLLVHAPGWDTPVVFRFLEAVRPAVAAHFGDLDPAGVRIYRRLRSRRPDLRWFVPDAWSELVAARGLPAAWPPGLDLADAPPLVRSLAARGLRLEQEPLVVDPRLPAALDALFRAADDTPGDAATIGP